VDIPAGALSATTNITLTTFKSASDINNKIGVTPFLCGAVFGPDGTVFAKPVTITLPLEKPLIPGEKYDIFVYDTATDKWYQMKEQGVCGLDGKTISYETNHFTIHMGSGMKDGSLSNFGRQLEQTGDAEASFNKLRNDIVNGQHVFDMRFERGSKCYSFSGIEFDVQYALNETQGQFVGNLIGERTGVPTTLSYFEDYMALIGSVEVQIVYSVNVNIYFEESPCEKPQVPSIFITSQIPWTSFNTNPWKIASWNMPANLPSYTGFSLSSSPHVHGGTVLSVTNAIELKVGADYVASFYWPSGYYGFSPVSIQLMEGKGGTVEFWNSYQDPGDSCMGGTTDVWIIYSP
jgi:hypothetical protein